MTELETQTGAKIKESNVLARLWRVKRLKDDDIEAKFISNLMPFVWFEGVCVWEGTSDLLCPKFNLAISSFLPCP
jgi:hypothetical protein